MKIGSKLQFEVPDKCPDNCSLRPYGYYQGCICDSCPVFCCRLIKGDYDEEEECFEPDWYLVEPNDYRDDFAYQFEEFFKNGKYPVLKINCRNTKE